MCIGKRAGLRTLDIRFGGYLETGIRNAVWPVRDDLNAYRPIVSPHDNIWPLGA